MTIAGNNITVSNDDARNWCMGIMEDGKEDSDNPLGAGAAGNVQRKLAALKGSLWSANRLVDYMIAIGDTKASDIRDDAYQFPGFTPDDPVQIFSTRWDNDFVSYSRDAHTTSWGCRGMPFVAARDVRRDVHDLLLPGEAAGQTWHVRPAGVLQPAREPA